MITLRKAKERGYFDHGWLKTYHTFSFADYHDPEHMGFGPLRVINEDVIEAGAGFPTHGHRDMEIITYVLEGAVAHKDSTGGEGVIRPGEVQMMTAGSGIRHSEFNGRNDVDTHLYQIWIRPNGQGLKPEYRERNFAEKLAAGDPVLLVSPDAREGSLAIHQDALLWARRFADGAPDWRLKLAENRLGWVQVARGKVTVNGQSLVVGDGAAIENEAQIEIKSEGAAEVLFFEMGNES